jgi:hypothetical protein
MSIVYVGTVIAVFIYWAIQTILLKGALLYTFHGIGALAVIILHVTGGIIGRRTSMMDRKNRGRHFNFNVAGYLIYTLTITAGFLLAFGWNILYIY